MGAPEMIVFMKKAMELKKVKRIGWVRKKVKDPESVADHSFSLALMAYVYGRKLGLDAERCMKMGLIHDMCEAYTGDIPGWSNPPPTRKKMMMKQRRERAGMRKIASLLPGDLDSEVLSLWEELEARKTSEARLVKDLDKLEMCMQALTYAKKERKKTDAMTKFRQFFEDGDVNIRTPEVRKLFEPLLAEYLKTIR
jgi:putative hydrolase of HD superfamily